MPDGRARDFRARYTLPEHFLWDEADRRRVQYDGYSRLVFRLLPPPPADVLDAGCGDGFFAARLLAAGYGAWGVDYADRAIGFARVLAEGATFRTFDLRDLGRADPFDRQFDVVVLVEVLEHVPPSDHALVMAGVSRLIRSGGCLVATVPSVHLRPMNRWHHKHFTVDEIRDLMAEAGLTVTDVMCQRRLSVLWSNQVWRAVQNRYYDLRVVRRVLRRVLLAHRNVTDDPGRAGRYVLRGVKP